MGPLFILLLAAASPLAGVWTVQLQSGEMKSFTLRPDGSGQRAEGPFTWRVDGHLLVATDATGAIETFPFVLRRGQLSLQLGGNWVVFTRAGGRAKVSPAAGAATPLAQLLQSSAWCSFSYNKVTGASSQSRVVFYANGTWSKGGRSETYATGNAGSYAGQQNSNAGGQWRVVGPELSMTSPPAVVAMTPVNLLIKSNASGAPILVADGVEYAQCR